MIELFGRQFINTKEAASRYGYSESWFEKAKRNGNGPKFIQMDKKGKVLYPLEETDLWFKRLMKIMD